MSDHRKSPVFGDFAQTLHGTAIYAAPLTPQTTTPTDRQSYGSPMGRVWVGTPH